jgi:hypothetical protein
LTEPYTCSHPNFEAKRKRRSGADYESFVARELERSKRRLEERRADLISIGALRSQSARTRFGLVEDLLDLGANRIAKMDEADLLFNLDFDQSRQKNVGCARRQA